MRRRDGCDGAAVTRPSPSEVDTTCVHGSAARFLIEGRALHDRSRRGLATKKFETPSRTLSAPSSSKTASFG